MNCRQFWSLLFLTLVLSMSGCASEIPKNGRLLFVAAPGIRNYLEYGGHGLLVYDIDNGHKFLRRISASGYDKEKKPDNVKGIAASAQTGRIYISTIGGIECLDFYSETQVWEKKYEKGCDRLAITADGKYLYAPGFEETHWYVINAANGELLKTIGDVPAGSHNTVMGENSVYLAGLRSPTLSIVDRQSNEIIRSVGRFGNVVRPFVVNGGETLVYANVNDLLGFEIGDLNTGRLLHRVETPGFNKGPVKRHGCPSHGIALTQDESEVWICDSFNQRLHIFDNTVMPPKYKQSIPVREEPGWITWSIDGALAYPSTGEVIDVKSKRILTSLQDENGKPVMSEKLLEIDFENGRAVRAGDQFANGMVK